MSTCRGARISTCRPGRAAETAANRSASPMRRADRVYVVLQSVVAAVEQNVTDDRWTAAMRLCCQGAAAQVSIDPAVPAVRALVCPGADRCRRRCPKRSPFRSCPETGWAAVMFDDNKLTAARLWVISAGRSGTRSPDGPRNQPYLARALYALIPHPATTYFG